MCFYIAFYLEREMALALFIGLPGTAAWELCAKWKLNMIYGYIMQEPAMN